MKKLIQGIRDFHRNNKSDYCIQFSDLAEKQSPDALFVACCDSRVVPNVFASTDPGDLFVVRNIGNSVPPYQAFGASDASVTAAIEFALLELKVKDIIICGHSDCGAMHAVLEQKDFPAGIAAWLDYAKSSYERFLKQRDGFVQGGMSPVNILSQVHVLQQLENLKTYPLVAEQVEQGFLSLHGWWFDLATADVFEYDAKKSIFVDIVK